MNKLEYKLNNFNFKYFLRDDVDLSVFNEIFKIGEYKIVNDIIKNAKNPIIDIGAHVGFFSIYSYCLNNNVLIYSIEPEKNNLDILLKHKNENNIINIKIIEGAIGGKSEDGELIIENDSINHKINSQIYKFTNSQINKKQNIKVFSLGDFFDKNNIEDVSLVKMDIEGGEYAIFQNLNTEDFSRIGAFILEYHVENSQIHKFTNSQINKKDQYYLENILRINGFSVQIFPSKFDKKMGFIFALNKRKK